MRVLLASKALVLSAYRRKLAEIAAQPGIDRLVAVVPPSWRDPGGREQRLEVGADAGYELRVEPIRFNGNFHLFYWPTLGRVIRETRPDVVHLDEEPYNLATALGVWQARGAAALPLFFTWQNLPRRYPPPFSLFERYVFRASRYALVGSTEAADVLRAKGYRGRMRLIPQFGFDPDLFSPALLPRVNSVPVVGYVARLREEKGIWWLLDALRALSEPWRLEIIGTGPLEAGARARIQAAGLTERVHWTAAVPSREMPDRYRGFDLLVQPSLTRPNWKEQFGRALVEAMACEVPVVGSDSGEIPRVAGDAGVIVPEGDVPALREAIATLLRDPQRRRDLGRRGRQRFLQCYTHQRIAEQTVDVYRALLDLPSSRLADRRAAPPRGPAFTG